MREPSNIFSQRITKWLKNIKCVFVVCIKLRKENWSTIILQEGLEPFASEEDAAFDRA